MFLKDVTNQMNTLFATSDGDGYTTIDPHINYQGDKITFRFYLEDDKYSRIELSPNASEILANCSGGNSAEAIMSKLSKPYNVEYDREKCVLFIRFRRNEMTLAEAILRLEQATLVAISANHITTP